ncbi:acyl CoA:acetate/3-ketoacid CoA transferase [Gordonia terrae]|uniref:Acyl CoA:acetate/3-ketoacid CoA transferase n=1 Tax=Gordonia terrae TaxID=2055 RepID=A0A2I1RAP8_9ACTN|nr:CoA-transferase [Gordonia terrae]PKZ66165.1 acyl CoA:acetate/3-ketoacid CoA transferase [Gordonia terrae]
MRSKGTRRPVVTSADAAVASIPTGATVAMTGAGGGILEPEALLTALETRFLGAGEPRDLTVVYALGMGDRMGGGTGRFAHPGMVSRVIGGLWTWSPELRELARREQLEAYALPGGVISQLFREIGARRPGLITTVGLGTFADPRCGGGRFTARGAAELVELVEFDGQEYLRYKPFRVDVALVRGDTMDRNGNIGWAGEAAQLDATSVAQAARASGGLVIAQVKNISDGVLDPHVVHLPAPLVDMVVEVPGQWQTHAGEYDDRLCRSGAPAPDAISASSPSGARAIIARRAAAEVGRGGVLNVGFGIPSLVIDALVAAGRSEDNTVLIEQGIIGGRPLSGDLFGAAIHPEVVHSSTTQFDLINGGLIDTTCLGMAQIDASGSVNVSRIAGEINGPGGFVEISQSADSVIFCGTFTADGLDVDVVAGRLCIRREGRLRKFVRTVEQVTFSGPHATARGQRVLVVTERAVFRLVDGGLELVEVAPGVDIERDILSHMDFVPLIDSPAQMDPDLLESVAARAVS